ncbi:rhodanese-like domain-containing protein [Cucumibacter marinus]|uniref:rhodanese-like domain-containing protein n=1 Tax=Cucumibacter marinus TaxID=1121252 RepID=UPI000417FF49|nr:rhodanese-like domain-containing protein [Cucumibacter marinus]
MFFSRPKVKTLSANDALQFAGDPSTAIIDVRGADEIARSGTVKGAVRAPLPALAAIADQSNTGRHPRLASAQQVLCICASGNRSAMAVKVLQDLGYADVGHIAGGFGAWAAAGGPTER